MEPLMAIILVLAVLLVLVVAAAVLLFVQKQRTERLRQGFGPEYDRTVRKYDDRGRAESELEARRTRVEQLHIRPLPQEDRARYSEAWRSVQAQFVDMPAAAVTQADRLVSEVMQARGYPVGDFEQRAADISVDHPQVVENYRAAHAIAGTNERGQAQTENLRQAMIHYRALFEDLLTGQEVQHQEVA